MDRASLANPQAVLDLLKVKDPGDWAAIWSQSEASFQPGKTFFLKPGFVEESLAFLRYEPEIVRAFLDALPVLRNQPAVERWLWHLHKLFFEILEWPSRKVKAWPMLSRDVVPGADMVYAVTLLSGLPHAREIYRKRGIPDEVVVDTLQSMAVWMRHYRRANDVWGLLNFKYPLLHFTGRIYRIGRLEYLFDMYCAPFRAFRNTVDRRVILLAEPGPRYRADGTCDGANDLYDTTRAWTPTLDLNAERITGYPASPQGPILRTKAKLPRDRWTQVLGQGDPTFSLHIPESGPLEHAACGESLRNAVAFFAKHHPEWPYRAFTCISWLLDFRFESCLKETSNIVQFLREFRLFPASGNDEDVLYRIYGRPGTIPATAPRDTSLRRAVVEQILAGRHWESGGAILFPEDLDWGAKIYRRMAFEDVIEWYP